MAPPFVVLYAQLCGGASCTRQCSLYQRGAGVWAIGRRGQGRFEEVLVGKFYLQKKVAAREIG
ncbi:hypothetical protein PVLB_17630 [Pseudomonas sp. VLB120]|nr:hypothetical protein PVLB_17630 [Pseudomonas sp. VLB120]